MFAALSPAAVLARALPPMEAAGAAGNIDCPIHKHAEFDNI